MIAEVLQHGQENPTTGRELAEMLNVNIRDITLQVERERREGAPICAASGDKPGYYLGNAEEIENYCGRLKHRATELFATRQALIRTLQKIADKQEA